MHQYLEHIGMDMSVPVVSLVVEKGKNKPRNKLNTPQWGNKHHGIVCSH